MGCINATSPTIPVEPPNDGRPKFDLHRCTVCSAGSISISRIFAKPTLNKDHGRTNQHSSVTLGTGSNNFRVPKLDNYLCVLIHGLDPVRLICTCRHVVRRRQTSNQVKRTRYPDIDGLDCQCEILNFLANMATTPRQAPGISSRRSACDRCRFSKARCQRKQRNQARCDRCYRNHTECVTSPVFRLKAWQPPLVDLNVSEEHVADGLDNCRQSLLAEQQNISQCESVMDVEALDSGVYSHVPGGNVSPRGIGYFTPSSLSSHINHPFGHDPDDELSSYEFANSSLIIGPNDALFGSMTSAALQSDSTASLAPWTPSNSASTCESYGRADQVRSSQLIHKGSIHTDTEEIPTPLQAISKLDHEFISSLFQLETKLSQDSARILFEASETLDFPQVMERMLCGTSKFVETLRLLTEPLSGEFRANPQASMPEHNSKGATMRQTSISSDVSDQGNYSDEHDDNLAATGRTSHGLHMSSLLGIVVAYTRLVQVHTTIIAQLHACLALLSAQKCSVIPLIDLPSLSNLPISELPQSLHKSQY